MNVVAIISRNIVLFCACDGIGSNTITPIYYSLFISFLFWPRSAFSWLEAFHNAHNNDYC